MTEEMAPLSVIASAPANTMLMGEHAVLFGYPALVCALQQRIYVQASKRSDGLLVIESALGQYQGDLVSPAQDSRFSFVLQAVKSAQVNDLGVTLTIHSDFSHTLGLGSSAAVTVATLAALALLRQAALDPQEIMYLAIDVIRSVQGRGSGADVAASALGGIVQFTAEPIKAKPIALTASAWQHTPPMCLVYCGYKTPTPKVIAQVAQAAALDGPYYGHIYANMGVCVVASIAALEQQDWLLFGDCMRQYQNLMRDLGVSDDTIEKILRLGAQQMSAAKSNPCAGKISGSGLGDCVLLMGTYSISGWPHVQMALKMEPQGVRKEHKMPNHNELQEHL